MSTESEFGAYNSKNVFPSLQIHILYLVAILELFSHIWIGSKVQCSYAEDKIFFLEVFCLLSLFPKVNKDGVKALQMIIMNLKAFKKKWGMGKVNWKVSFFSNPSLKMLL